MEVREILFKAKRISNGEWVEGHLLRNKKDYYICSNPNQCMVGYGSLQGQHYGFSNFVFVDKNTICQYTGLTDKNGNKIWENDILRGHDNPKDLAKVVHGSFYVIDVETLESVDSVIGWHTEVIPTDELSKSEPFCLPMPLNEFYIDRSEFEVIGNIFDNPELLEVDWSE